MKKTLRNWAFASLPSVVVIALLAFGVYVLPGCATSSLSPDGATTTVSVDTEALQAVADIAPIAAALFGQYTVLTGQIEAAQDAAEQAALRALLETVATQIVNLGLVVPPA